jgi:pyruvate kinase
MRRHRKAKIVATLGPASSDQNIIRALFEAGADVFRFNFSHGTHQDHQARYDIVHRVEQETGRPIAVLADLQGPSASFGLDLDDKPGDQNRVGMPRPEIFQALKPGVELLLDDGKVRLVVESCAPTHAITRVVVPGTLSDRRGRQRDRCGAAAFGADGKDRRDLDFALNMGADWAALSFVQRPEDIKEMRDLVAGRANVMAKLEKRSVNDRLTEIVELSDGIMVARGDLGVEMPPETVPVVQRRILRACCKAGKPVIVATQMLESMITTPTPTRAEASDVATAVYDGSDAVMLSAESASGQFPLEAVRFMDRIIASVEQDSHYRQTIDAAHPDAEPTLSDAICCALRGAAGLLNVAVAVTYISSGYTSLHAARERPASPILSLSANRTIARRMSLVWGVHSIITHELRDITDVTANASRIALDEGFAQKGDVTAIPADIRRGRKYQPLKLAIVDRSDAAVGRRRKGGTQECLALGPPVRSGATRVPVTW